MKWSKKVMIKKHQRRSIYAKLPKNLFEAATKELETYQRKPKY